MKRVSRRRLTARGFNYWNGTLRQSNMRQNVEYCMEGTQCLEMDLLLIDLDRVVFVFFSEPAYDLKFSMKYDPKV